MRGWLLLIVWAAGCGTARTPKTSRNDGASPGAEAGAPAMGDRTAAVADSPVPPPDAEARDRAAPATDSPSEAAPVPPAAGPIRVTDNVLDEGLSCFKIETPSATYFYDKKGGGFSSILDRAGNDWVGFHPQGGFNGNFRGIPNLGPCCHAGNPDSHDGPAMTSRIVEQQPERVRISSTTADGRFDVTWEFRLAHATLTVTRMGGQKFWFLYEGTPGGLLDAGDYWVTSAGLKRQIQVRHNGDFPAPEWVYFGDGKQPRVLFTAHHEDDAIEDQHYSGALGSMIVFGFGRTAATTLMTAVPRHFSIGFVEATDHPTVTRAVQAALDAR